MKAHFSFLPLFPALCHAAGFAQSAGPSTTIGTHVLTLGVSESTVLRRSCNSLRAVRGLLHSMGARCAGTQSRDNWVDSWARVRSSTSFARGSYCMVAARLLACRDIVASDRFSPYDKSAEVKPYVYGIGGIAYVLKELGITGSCPVQPQSDSLCIIGFRSLLWAKSE
jgi:hypothetical protein